MKTDNDQKTGNTDKTDYNETVDVTLGNRTVQVPKGGIYDTYHMKTDLDAMLKDERVTSVDFFKALEKREVMSPIGPTMTPNYYYRTWTARLVMTAPVSAIKTRLPEGLDPLEMLPGIGLVSLMFFRYDVCDIDKYSEAAVAILVRPPRHGGLNGVDLIAGLKNEDMYVHVLSLPVTTEIAQVRGHDGYGFPKWVTEINFNVDKDKTTAVIMNDSGGIDIKLTAGTPTQKHFKSGENVSTLHSITKLDEVWNETLSQTNVMSLGKKVMPSDVRLRLGKGRVSSDLRSLKVGKILQFEVSENSQVALHMPQPISVRKV